MTNFIQTLLIACIPALITGLITYFVAQKNASSQIKIVKEQNKHDIEHLMEQHHIDIDSLEKKHQLELEKMEVEHNHNLELIAKENENNLNQNLMTGLFGEVMKMPEVKDEIAKGIKISSQKRNGGRR